MKKTYSKSSRQGLPGGPNEMFEKVKGIIVSQRGQWDFPGMNTLVPTDDGRITMRGVPYPVYGQDETGYGQMMYPNQEYQFPGNNVLELPMAQRGGGLPKFQGVARSQVPTYNDSLDLYKNTVALENFLRSKKAAIPTSKFEKWQWENSQPIVGTTRNWYTVNPTLSPREKALAYANSLYDIDKSTADKSLSRDNYVKTQNNLIGTRDWATGGGDDKDFPVSYVHPKIKPQFEGDTQIPGEGMFYMYRYDPVAIKPGALLTPKELALRLKKYGKRGIPQSKIDEYYASKNPVTPLVTPPANIIDINKPNQQTSRKEFVRNINQFPFQLGPNQYEQRVSLNTPLHTYMMNLDQYSKLLPTDSIPQQGNFLYRLNRQQLGGSLPTAQMLGQFNPQLARPNPITGLYNWEKPRVKPKLSDFEPKQKAAPRSSTSVATKSDPVKAARQINSVAAEEYERNRQGVIRATNRPVSVFRPGAGDPEAVMGFMGVPGTVRFVKNPAQGLKGAGNTIVDLGLTVSPFANMNPAAGLKYAAQGINPLTGEGSFRAEDVEGAFNTLDAAGLATLAGAALKAPLQQGLRQTGNIAKTGLREGVDLFHPVGRNLKRIEQEGISKGLSAQAIKNRQMQEVGITSLQREGYFPGVSEILSEYFVPYSYDNPVKRLLNIPKKIIKGDRNTKRLADLNKVIFDAGKNTLSKPRYDAWRMYSGLPQKHGTFRIAETHPINHPSYTKNQLNNLEKFSLNDERKLLSNLPNEYDNFRFMYNDEDLIEAVPYLKEELANINKLQKKGIDFPESDFIATNVMGGYNRRFFDNKMEYNDIWDLDLKGLKVDKYFGKPFMSHGQLEYSFEPTKNYINALLRRADMLEKNINPFTKYNFDNINLKDYNNINNNIIYKDFVKPKKQLGGSLPKAQVGGDEIFPGEGQYYNIPEYTYNYKRGFDDLPDPVYSGPLMSQRLIDEATQREYEQRRRAIEESVAAAREPLSTQRLARESAATGDKFSLQMNLGDPYNNPRLYETLGALDFINPGVMLGDMVTGLGSVPYNVQEGNYGAATFGLGLPLATGALASIGVKTPRQFVNNLVNPVAGIGDTPKQLPGSANTFKSEIDWRNWVKYKEDFDNNPQVIKHLNDIEQTTKANGTWMKNSDGSPFQGTPEQFVVQQSDNFKKAFGNSEVKDDIGNLIIMHHGSPQDNIQELLPPKYNPNWTEGRTATDKNTTYNFLTPLKNIAEKYSRKDLLGYHTGDNLSLYVNSEKPLFTNDYIELANPDKYINNHILDNYDIITNMKFKKDFNPKDFSEIALPFKNKAKSAIGNILFDMTNPNIYKSLAPVIGAGAYGANQMQDAQPTMQRFGGNLNFQGGGNYNMQRALELGYTPDEAGHYPSVDSETGMWLKSKQHPTAWMESMYGYQLNPEVYNNYNVVYNPEGYFGENQLQYVPKKFGGSLSTAGDPVLNFIQSQSPRFSKSKK